MYPMKSPLIQLKPSDNVAVACEPIDIGTYFLDLNVRARATIPVGHKIAHKAIAGGNPVLKYGQPIGNATRDVAPGDHVHTGNLKTWISQREYEYCLDAQAPLLIPAPSRAGFMGYQRSTGKVGTRNYLAVMSSANCSAPVCQAIVRRFNGTGTLDAFPNVDGVIALTHGGGCAINIKGEGYRYLREPWPATLSMQTLARYR
jgi:galactarate dehydratase